MAWQDRLLEPFYTSPSGRKLVFQYEDVRKSFNKHTSSYDFPEVDGSFIQDLGRSGRRIPLRMIFSGDDHDLTADTFDEMLGERGVGTLGHPLYGEIRVVPFGVIDRQDLLKTAGNQTIFTVTFFETNELLFPLSILSPGDLLKASIATTLGVNAELLSVKVDVSTVIKNVSFLDRYRTVIDRAKAALKPIADTIAEIGQQFDLVSDAIDDALDTFIGTPLSLASQCGILMGLPSRSSALIADKLDAYGNLLLQVTGSGSSEGVIYVPGLDSQPVNSFLNDDMQATALLTGTASSLLNNEFETKTEALDAATTILDQFAQWVIWRDLNLVSLGLVDTGEVYQQVEQMVSLAAGFLVEISFSLKQERSLVLIRPQTPIDLESQLYGTVDVNLDFLIASNDLVGEEILEVPLGRRVVYFV